MTTKIDPTRISPDELAQILTAAGSVPITTATIRAHIAAGAPTNDDATLNVIHYTAWLAARLGYGP